MATPAPTPTTPPEPTEVEQFLTELETTTPPPVEPTPAPVEPEVVPPRESPAPPAPTEPLVQVQEELARTKLELETLRKSVVTPTTIPPTTAAPPREPEIEMIETLGVRIPKDPTKRAIRITADDLVKLGWNNDVAGAINVLGNVLWAYVDAAMVQPAMSQVRFNLARERERESVLGQFYVDHPDLKGQDDLLQMTESKIRGDEPDYHTKVKTPKEYMDRVGEAARRRIAGWRGVSLEDYVASLPKGTTTSPMRTTTGRAVTTPSSARGPASAATDLQKDMADTAEGAVRR